MSDDQQQGREYFAFFHSYRNAVARLSKKDQLQALWSIINYGLDGLLPDDKGDANALAVFYAIVPNIDKSRKLSKVRSDAGAIGGKQTQANAKQNQANGSKPQAKSSKRQANGSKTHEEEEEVEVEVEEEKKKKKEFAPHVHLTQAEYDKLVAKHGETCVVWCIEKLDSFKKAKGRTYKSDEGAIRQWVIDAYQKAHPEATNRNSDDVIADRERKIDDGIEELRRTHPEAQIL